MKCYTLYYLVSFPDSQIWMEKEGLVETGYVIPIEDTTSCFVDKDVIDNANGL